MTMTDEAVVAFSRHCGKWEVSQTGMDDDYERE